jgi:hypothetical protein
VELAALEEGVVLRRGSLALCPFGGEEYCGVGALLRYQIYTNTNLFFFKKNYSTCSVICLLRP